MAETLRLAITPGEPAGIGPDLLIQLAQQKNPHELVAYCAPSLLEQRAKQLNLPLKIREPGDTPHPLKISEICIHPVPLGAPVEAGILNRHNAEYVLKSLTQAATDCLNNKASALITGPVNKAIINDAGIPFSGHTEFFADLSHTPKVVMMLATAGLKVALATTHLPLRAVPDAITAELLSEIISILHHDLQVWFNLAQPRIMVCGLNPHAGEGGHMGTEEQGVIEPVLAQLNNQGMTLIGPVPADTAFTKTQMASADVILAMYHDQGLPVLKHLGFGSAVNITLGLPFIRTSVDHGTALDLAGKGTADVGSLLTARDYAIQMASSH